jgi:hypothetical protein
MRFIRLDLTGDNCLAHKLEHALHVKMMLTCTSFHLAYKLDHVLHVKMMPTCTSFHLAHK